jgi:NAD(P)-dependent dehydrogenase (short-subunit alcohol dehydrogenase family)
MFELSDKVALITGASGGIGMSIVKKWNNVELN